MLLPEPDPKDREVLKRTTPGKSSKPTTWLACLRQLMTGLWNASIVWSNNILPSPFASLQIMATVLVMVWPVGFQHISHLKDCKTMRILPQRHMIRQLWLTDEAMDRLPSHHLDHLFYAFISTLVDLKSIILCQVFPHSMGHESCCESVTFRGGDQSSRAFLPSPSIDLWKLCSLRWSVVLKIDRDNLLPGFARQFWRDGVVRTALVPIWFAACWIRQADSSEPGVWVLNPKPRSTIWEGNDM